MHRILLLLVLAAALVAVGPCGCVDVADRRSRPAPVLLRPVAPVCGRPASRYRHRRRSRRHGARSRLGARDVRRDRPGQWKVGDDPHLRRLVGDAHATGITRCGQGRDGRRGRRRRDDRPQRRCRGERCLCPARDPARGSGPGICGSTLAAARPHGARRRIGRAERPLERWCCERAGGGVAGRRRRSVGSGRLPGRGLRIAAAGTRTGFDVDVDARTDLDAGTDLDAHTDVDAGTDVYAAPASVDATTPSSTVPHDPVANLPAHAPARALPVVRSRPAAPAATPTVRAVAPAPVPAHTTKTLEHSTPAVRTVPPVVRAQAPVSTALPAAAAPAAKPKQEAPHHRASASTPHLPAATRHGIPRVRPAVMVDGTVASLLPTGRRHHRSHPASIGRPPREQASRSGSAGSPSSCRASPSSPFSPWAGERSPRHPLV